MAGAERDHSTHVIRHCGQAPWSSSDPQTKHRVNRSVEVAGAASAGAGCGSGGGGPAGGARAGADAFWGGAPLDREETGDGGGAARSGAGSFSRGFRRNSSIKSATVRLA